MWYNEITHAILRSLAMRKVLKLRGIVIYTRSQEPINRAHINDSIKSNLRSLYEKL